MQYIVFRDLFKDFLVISRKDIDAVEEGFRPALLSQWQKKGYITKIINSFYVFSDQEITEQALYVMANKIYAPSYVSLQSGLSYHQLIPESLFGVTSVCSRKTKSFLNTAFGAFHYRSMKPALMFGYELVSYKGFYFRMATVEKSLLDLLYLHDKLCSVGDILGLRIDKSQCKKAINRGRFDYYLSLFNNDALKQRSQLFWCAMEEREL